MKTVSVFGGLVLVAFSFVVGCGSADEGSSSESEIVAKDEPAPAGGKCFSERDKKDYDVGEKLVGNHAAERCPPTTKVCLAPDSNYESECQANGTWLVQDKGFVGGGM